MPRTKETRNFSGSVFRREIKRANGKVIVVYDARKRYTDETGRVRDKFKRCRSAKEANIALTNFENEIAAAAMGDAGESATFFQLCDYFEREYLKPAVVVHQRQIAGYRQNVKALEQYLKIYREAFGDILLRRLSYEQIRRFAEKLMTTPIVSKHTPPHFPTVATVNRKLAYLRRVLNIGVQLRWLDRNPFNAGKSLINARAENKRYKILTFDEERRLLNACLTDDEQEKERNGKPYYARKTTPRLHLYPIIITALDTGMRKAEIFALKRSQVDLGEKIITLEFQQTKSFKERIIPISERLEKVLTEKFAAFPLKPDDLVFGGIKRCDRSFNSALAKAGIDDFVFHSLRHVAITWFDLAGISEAVKKNIVGHSTSDVHQSYNNVSADTLKDARAKINDFRRKIEAELEEKETAAKTTNSG